MKKIHRYVLILFFVFLLSIPAYWMLKGNSPEVSTVEARELVALAPAESPNLQRAIHLFNEGNWKGAAEILLNLYTSSSFTNKFETATSDQFPFRMTIIRFSKALDRVIIKIAYQFVDDTIIPADMTSDIYFDKLNDQLIFSPTLFTAETINQIDERVQNYQELIDTHTEQKFYLFYHQTLENSKYHPLNVHFPKADQGQALAYFESNLPQALTFEKFLLGGMDDHLKYYYRTDHHWNVYGIFRAYEEIYDLLKNDQPNMSEKLTENRIISFPDIEFLGLLARRTFYPVSSESFAVEDIDFPNYEMYVNGQKVEENLRAAYFEGNYSTVPYTNHYNEFYGFVTDLTEYRFQNESERSLLLIGSSYRYALDPLIASHYHLTYSVDLRYFTDFSLSEFLESHEVDDILIIGDNTVGFEDTEYWKIKP